ncbi:MAG: periplasmic heavy metal sensor [Luteitalea sp.]|nr:periplasmic heavy metal sensor [Luteitalea sp.]
MPRRWIISFLLIVAFVVGAPRLAVELKAGCALPEHPAAGALEEKQARKWWRWDLCQAEIGLTDKQSDKLEGIFQSLLPDLHRLKEDLDQRETHLSTLLVEGTKEAKVREAIDHVEESRSELGRTRALMLYRMYKVLSPDQRRKLKAFWERREKEQESSQDPPSARRQL